MRAVLSVSGSGGTAEEEPLYRYKSPRERRVEQPWETQTKLGEKSMGIIEKLSGGKIYYCIYFAINNR